MITVTSKRTEPITVGKRYTPQMTLMRNGPVFRAVLSIARPQQKAMGLKDRDSNFISGEALIDTGASLSCFDITAAQRLGLPVIGRVHIASATDPASFAPLFLGELEVEAMPSLFKYGVGAHLKNQGLIALVGRNFLRSCTIFYNGPEGAVTLTY